MGMLTCTYSVLSTDFINGAVHHFSPAFLRASLSWVKGSWLVFLVILILQVGLERRRVLSLRAPAGVPAGGEGTGKERLRGVPYDAEGEELERLYRGVRDLVGRHPDTYD